MKKTLTALSFVFLLNQSYSQVTQEWAARKNGPGNLADEAWCTTVDNSDNVYVTGYSWDSAKGYDCSTIKYNSSGVQQWEARYDGPGHSTDAGHQIKVDVSGNVYVAGYSRNGLTAGTEDYITIKYNSAGVQLWASRYNGTGNNEDIAYQISVDVAGNVYVTGSSVGSGSGTDYVTIKYNSAGDSSWVKRYNGPGNSIDNSYRIAVSDSGNVYVTGYSRSSAAAGSEDIATIKYNNAGVQQWVQRFNNGANEIGVAIAVDGSGNVYVAGFAWNGFSYIDCLALKYNSSGVQQWVNLLAESGIGVLHSLAIDASGNVYATGYSAVNGNDDYVTAKYNSAGTYQWGKYYNGPGNGADTAYSLTLDGSGNVYVTGTSFGIGTGNDYATIKYNPAGVEQWVQRYNGPGNGTDIARSITIDGSGNVYITGRSQGSGTGNDYATIKYSQTSSLLTLNLTAFIQGFYNSVSNNMISDSARVYLRNASSPFNRIDSSKVKLSSSGTGTFLFSNAVNGVNYYLEVKHRNTLETWSSSAITFTSGTSNYNFATVTTQAYGSNEIQVDLSPLRHAMYSGEIYKDGYIDLTDINLIYNDASNFVTGYIITDVTGDNITDLTDLVLSFNNSSNFVSIKRP